ncbi:hypothetical protein HY3_08140 [Hyphomonas pacifica]|uniref:O-antigen ligase-related domain-containing protein n=2 Tax=Hyphomonas pacifica TaxID=1280941 RepID=A0A062U4C3_9PROT|nr:hypothetical protein HY2_11345 [Hyphomonas pacifica]RAN35500.1 hypothetical protein HY3_08140 [Hyphomonas pacifica]
MTEAAEYRKMRGMSYAPFLAAAYLLWPVMGLLGGQGYAPLLVLAAIPALFITRLGTKPAMYLLAAMAFVVWAILSEIWSPASRGFASGNLLEGDFAVRSAGLRVALTLAFSTILVAGALKIAQGRAQLSSRLTLGAFAVQGLLVFLSVLLGNEVLPLIYGDSPLRLGEGMQNIGRNANALALVLPVLVAYLMVRPTLAWKGLALFITLASVIAFASIEASAAMIGAVLMLAAFAIVRFFPCHGLRALFLAVAGYVAFAPFLIGGLIYALAKAGISLPGSFQSRAWSWEVVIGKIQQAPLFGHGIEASKTWRETYADHPDWLALLPDFWAQYPVVPGHPHNMALQIWGETGAVGAAFAALTIGLIGWRLPPATELRGDIGYAIAGMLAVATCQFSFSYSVWNEAFWASLVLAVGSIILLARREREAL